MTNDGGTFDSLGDGPEQARIAWTTQHSLSNDPNKATISIYNLSPERVAQMQGVVIVRQEWTPAERAELLAKGDSGEPYEQTTDSLGLGQVELYWGAADSEDLSREAIESALALGFSGQIIDGPTETREGEDTILVMQCQDAGETLGAAEVVQEAGQSAAAFESRSYAPGTRISAVVADMARAIGLVVTAENEAKIDMQIVLALAARGLPGADAELLGGYNPSGPVRPQLENFLSKSLGLRWTIYNGELFIFAPGDVLPGFTPLQLSTDRANVLGRPKVAADWVTTSTQATTSAIPGRQIDLDTETIAASGPVDQATTRADTDSGGTTEIRFQQFTSLVDSL
jgi:hypothetical protein